MELTPPYIKYSSTKRHGAYWVHQNPTVCEQGEGVSNQWVNNWAPKLVHWLLTIVTDFVLISSKYLSCLKFVLKKLYLVGA